MPSKPFDELKATFEAFLQSPQAQPATADVKAVLAALFSAIMELDPEQTARRLPRVPLFHFNSRIEEVIWGLIPKPLRWTLDGRQGQ